MLNIIKNNSFRFIGTSVNVKVKERLANISKIKAYTRVGKKISFPLDLPDYLGEINRNSEMMEKALSVLNSEKELVKNALFWLYTITPNQKEGAKFLSESKMKKAEDSYKKDSDFASLISLSTISFIRKRKTSSIRFLDAFIIDKEKKDSFISFLSDLAGHTVTFSEEDLYRLVIENLLEDISVKDILKVYKLIDKEYPHPSHKIIIDIINSNESEFLIKELEILIKGIENEKEEDVDEKKFVDRCGYFVEEASSQLKDLKKSINNDLLKYQDISNRVSEALYKYISIFFKRDLVITQPEIKQIKEFAIKARSYTSSKILRSDYDSMIASFSFQIDIFGKKGKFFL